MSPEHPLRLTTVAFTAARCVMTGVEIGLFEALRGGPRAPSELAAALELRADGLTTIVDVLVSLGLLVRVRTEVGLSAEVAALLLDGGAESVSDLIRFDRDLWDLTADLGARVQAPSHPDVHTRRGDPGFWSRYLAALNVAASDTPLALGEVVAERCSGPPTRILDLGGGGGAYALGQLQVFPDARITIGDLPDALDSMPAAVAAEPRITLAPGDLRAPPWGGAWDVALLVNVVPHLSADDRRALFAWTAEALLPGGLFVVLSPSRERGDSVEAAAGALVFWLMCGRALPTAHELAADLVGAGFTDIAEHALVEAPGSTLLTAFAPEQQPGSIRRYVDTDP